MGLSVSTPRAFIFVLHIMVFPALCKQETRGEQKGKHFGHRDSQPDTVYVEKKRQDQYGCGLEDQRPHKRDRRRDRPVV